MSPVPAARPRARRIDELEGLRGLLALWVAVSHVACLGGLDALKPAPLRQSLWDWLLYAGPAVDVFIILSGFAIFKMLQATPLGYRAFLTGRAFRLFPVFLVCLLLAVATTPLSRDLAANAPWHSTDYYQRWAAGLAALAVHWPLQLGLQLTLLHGLVPAAWIPPLGVVNFLPPAWSATLEWQFYLVAPALVAFSATARSWSKLGLLLIAALGVALLSGGNNPAHASFLGAKLWLFVVGMISAQLHTRWRFLPANAQRWWWLPALVFAVASTFVFHTPAVFLWLLILAGVVSAKDRGAGLRWILTRRPLLWLGSISYSLYLLHWPLLVGALALMRHFFPAIKGPAAAGGWLLAGLPVVLGLAGCLHVWLEAPLMRWGRQLARGQV